MPAQAYVCRLYFANSVCDLIFPLDKQVGERSENAWRQRARRRCISSSRAGLLGGKGANLAEMANIGLPVPPGFTITAEACGQYFASGKKWPEGLEEEVKENLARLEKVTGQKLGDREDPLLVSVRSGAAVSMPGMMDTILNLGLNDEAVVGLAKQSGDERFAWDCYRRFIEMFGNVAMKVPHRIFDEVLTEARKKAGVKFDSQLSAEQLKEVVARFKRIYEENTGEDFPGR